MAALKHRDLEAEVKTECLTADGYQFFSITFSQLLGQTFNFFFFLSHPEFISFLLVIVVFDIKKFY